MTDEQDNEPLHAPDLVMDVENFGPIAEARNIAFKPMTVFVGQSNTGKSYLALLLHSILQGFAETPWFTSTVRIDGIELPSWSPSEDLVAALNRLSRETGAMTQRVLTNGDANSQSEVGIGSFTPQSGELIRENLDFRLAAITRHVETSICESFEVGENADLANLGIESEANPAWTIWKSSSNGDWGLRSNPGGPRFDEDYDRLRWRPERLAEAFRRLESHNGQNRTDYMTNLLLAAIIADAIGQIAPTHRSWYLPASRTGILVSHRVLTDAIVANAHRVGLEGHRSSGPRYHKVAADFLRAINAIDPEARRLWHGESGDDFGGDSRIAKLIEQSVISGQIGVEVNEFGPPEFKFAPDDYPGLHVPMMRSSSMATELAPIVAFLRSHLSNGDLLIIEEPEAHLHPAAQQRMAAVLAYMVRKGLRVLITTHSHYMVEAMGMFVASSPVAPDQRARAMRLLGDEVDRELYLTEDEVAVYSFDEQAGSAGTVVRPVPFDTGSYSFAPDGYSRALVDQFNRTSRVIDARITFDELAEAT